MTLHPDILHYYKFYDSRLTRGPCNKVKIKWKSKTRVTSSDPLQVRITRSNPRVTCSDSRVTSSNPRVRRLKVRVA